VPPQQRLWVGPHEATAGGCQWQAQHCGGAAIMPLLHGILLVSNAWSMTLCAFRRSKGCAQLCVDCLQDGLSLVGQEVSVLSWSDWRRQQSAHSDGMMLLSDGAGVTPPHSSTTLVVPSGACTILICTTHSSH
jgi:hypothetical protein